MISAAATKQRSKTMSPMIETTAVGLLTVPPLPAPIASTMIVPTEPRIRPKTIAAGAAHHPRSGCRRGHLGRSGHIAVGA